LSAHVRIEPRTLDACMQPCISRCTAPSPRSSETYMHIRCGTLLCTRQRKHKECMYAARHPGCTAPVPATLRPTRLIDVAWCPSPIEPRTPDACMQPCISRCTAASRRSSETYMRIRRGALPWTRPRTREQCMYAVRHPECRNPNMHEKGDCVTCIYTLPIMILSRNDMAFKNAVGGCSTPRLLPARTNSNLVMRRLDLVTQRRDLGLECAAPRQRPPRLGVAAFNGGRRGADCAAQGMCLLQGADDQWQAEQQRTRAVGGGAQGFGEQVRAQISRGGGGGGGGRERRRTACSRGDGG
jgi:hypothetical protein